MKKFVVNEANIDRYIEVEEEVIGTHYVDSVPLDDFDYDDRDVVLSINNQESGHTDRYVVVENKLYLIDDLNDDVAMELDINEEHLLECYDEFLQ